VSQSTAEMRSSMGDDLVLDASVIADGGVSELTNPHEILVGLCIIAGLIGSNAVLVMLGTASRWAETPSASQSRCSPSGTFHSPSLLWACSWSSSWRLSTSCATGCG